MKILLLHANAGHGHKKVAEVTAKALAAAGWPNNQVEVLDALDKTNPLFRAMYPATYFFAVKNISSIWGWFYETLDLSYIYKPLRWLRSLNNLLPGFPLLKYIETEKPDLIISSHFFSAELVATAKRKGKLQCKLITVVTDFMPHTFWVNDGTDYYWVMGEEGKSDLQRRGVPQEKIMVGGIPVDPAFKPSGRKAEILKGYGFTTDRLTLLLTSGSFGLGRQTEILEQLSEFSSKIQCFVVCGQNAQLKNELEARVFPFPVKVFGFVDFMADLMEASDLLLAKPGGATTTESLAKNLPMVLMDAIPGQESRNAEILKGRQAAFALEHPPQIKTIMAAVFANPGLLEQKKQAVRSLARPDAAADLAKFAVQLIAKS